jgi:tetratricopeptide (TPR) repeat protein
MDPTTARERRWWNQLRCGDAEAGAEAGFALSALLCDRGREDEAEVLLTECSRSANDSIAASAALRLARLIERRRGPAAAEPSYEQAAERATPSVSADVLIDLAERWDTQGETDRARRAYAASAAGSLQPRLRAVAFFRLGALDRDAGRLKEAIDAWEDGLADAAGTLRIHLLVEIAEALADQGTGDPDRIESLLTEAIDSDHPDLAPRAALRLAQVKRARGQFIDAYRLARLVVGSEHPIFAADGEVESQRLLHGELDSLLQLEAPAPDQLPLPGMLDRTNSAVDLYFSIRPRDVHPECSDIWHPRHNERSTTWHRNQLPSGRAALWSPRPGHWDGDNGVGGGALLTDLLTRLDRDELSAWRPDGDPGRGRHGHGCGCREDDFLASWRDHRASARCDRRDLEFLLLLRATGWLQSESLSPERRVPIGRLRLVFERTTKRLMDLLAIDRRPFRDREAIWLMGILDGQGGGESPGVSEVVPPPLIGYPSRGPEVMAGAAEGPFGESAAISALATTA